MKTLTTFFETIERAERELTESSRCKICGEIYGCPCGKYPPEVVDEMITAKDEMK